VARLNTTPPREEGDAPPARLEVTIAGGGGKLRTLPGRRIYYLAVNHAHPYLGGETGQPVRHLIASAIGRDAILTACFRAGYAVHQPLNGPFPPHTWPCSPLVSTLDEPALAPVLVKEVARALAGRREHLVLDLKYPAGDPAVEQACQMMVQQVAERKPGFTLRAVPVPPEKLDHQVEVETDYHLAYRHFDYPDEWFNPAGLLDPKATGPGGRNALNYRPPETFEGLLVACQSHRDFDKLRRAMHRLHAEFRTELPFIPLWHLDTHALLSDRLRTVPDPHLLDPLAPFVHIDRWELR
jgi:ABC-type oligopeptide transport system substrate-binding subunit